MYADLGPLGEDADHVEAQGVEGWFLGVEVVFGYGADGVLFGELGYETGAGAHKLWPPL